MKVADRANKTKDAKPKLKRKLSNNRQRLDNQIRKSLKPVAKSRSGLAFYDYEEVAALNITFPKKK